MNIPGSDSSAFTTRKEGRPSLLRGMKDHLRPEGKPAPPRPRRPEALISLTIQSGPCHMSSLVMCQSPRCFFVCVCVCVRERENDLVRSFDHVIVHGTSKQINTHTQTHTHLHRGINPPIPLSIEVGENAILVLQTAVDFRHGGGGLRGRGGGGCVCVCVCW